MRNATRRNWKARVLLSSALLPFVCGIGCQSMNNTESGVLGGGAIGALIGALAGGPRHAAVGALAGGVLGATVGGVAGASADNRDQKMAAAAANAAAARDAALRNPPLSLEDIARLTAGGSSDEIIIGQIRNSGSVYLLTADQLVWLQNSGVHEPVIREMQATAYRAQPGYAVGPGQPVYVYEPYAPPPPPGVAVGVAVGRRW